ncbi:MAG: phosphoribosylglycinamide formyltransferase [Thermoguttaceae bacterium]|nr:phosphoribosylglycinamide formyltransferase [Thermoguttaceae bacterium]MDW8079917.1 formyltransferase family protein [Thermoguttaceae bacterium]
MSIPRFERTPLRLAALISGRGRALENLIQRSEAGTLNARVVLVMAPSTRTPGLQVAEKRGIPIRIVSAGDYAPLIVEEQIARFSDAVFAACQQAQVDLLVLAGFVGRIRVPPSFAYRVISTHPALTPAFSDPHLFGLQVYEAVVAYGVKITGCTVHFVDDHPHLGPVIFQQPVEVREHDTVTSLEARVFALECDLLPEAINLLAANRLVADGRRVRILPPPGAS